MQLSFKFQLQENVDTEIINRNIAKRGILSKNFKKSKIFILFL